MITSIFPSQRFWSALFCIFKYSRAHKKLLTWEDGLPGPLDFYRYVCKRVYHFDKKCSGYLLFFSQMIILEYIFTVFYIFSSENTWTDSCCQRDTESRGVWGWGHHSTWLSSVSSEPRWDAVLVRFCPVSQEQFHS